MSNIGILGIEALPTSSAQEANTQDGLNQAKVSD